MCLLSVAQSYYSTTTKNSRGGKGEKSAWRCESSSACTDLSTFNETGETLGIQREAKLLIPSFCIDMISILMLALFWIDSLTPSNLT